MNCRKRLSSIRRAAATSASLLLLSSVALTACGPGQSSKLVVTQIVTEFGGLDELLAATDADLEAVEGVGEIRAKDIREGLRRLQELNLVDRYLQT